MSEPLEALVARLLQVATIDEESGRRRLPPERDLCEALGMSRGALREQLAVLERLGFVQRAQGRGTYLADPTSEFVSSYFSLSRALGLVSDEEFAESRVMVEESIAEAAATRATPEQVAVLRADVDRMIESAESGDEVAALEADLAFHRHLERAVGNSVLRLLHAGLYHVLRADIAARRRELARTAGGGVSRYADDRVHHEIVDAIEARDPESARRAMRRHFGVAGTDTAEASEPGRLTNSGSGA
ncbi:FadR/GntR family transcriptional regulator [Microbacterium yannicii]|uniref:FadR/GntR family transcriptional regulator n=1 Tax=Microbacterium yannicii TaxID=671622 RepID=UPI0002EA8080|nr:FCD domain-containing protein [Microbacterium yannicii]